MIIHLYKWQNDFYQKHIRGEYDYNKNYVVHFNRKLLSPWVRAEHNRRMIELRDYT